MKLNREQVLGLVRHSLTFVGGVIVANGLLTDAAVTEIVGAIITCVGSVWSVIEKNKQ